MGLFWRLQAATQVYIIYKVASRNYRYAIQIAQRYLVFGNCLFVPTQPRTFSGKND